MTKTASCPLHAFTVFFARPQRSKKMVKQKYVYWQDEDMWLGYLEEFPDYWSQGETEEELKENLTDIYKELSSGTIPHVLRVAELEIA